MIKDKVIRVILEFFAVGDKGNGFIFRQSFHYFDMEASKVNVSARMCINNVRKWYSIAQELGGCLDWLKLFEQFSGLNWLKNRALFASEQI